MKPCKPGQERNPLTNRCKKISTRRSRSPIRKSRSPIRKSRSPLRKSPVRKSPVRKSPKHRRSRSRSRSMPRTLMPIPKNLKPCKKGKIRNPNTHRCIKACKQIDKKLKRDHVEFICIDYRNDNDLIAQCIRCGKIYKTKLSVLYKRKKDCGYCKIRSRSLPKSTLMSPSSQRSEWNSWKDTMPVLR